MTAAPAKSQEKVNKDWQFPARPMTLDEFREWAGGEELPEKCVVYYVRGEGGIDVHGECLFSHTAVNGAILATLRNHATRNDLGMYLSKGVLLTNVPAQLSCNPDGLFARYESFRSKRIVAVESKSSGHDELLGTPDMVQEIVSSDSVEKDNVILKNAYWEAGIPEYWLVDARAEKPTFRILTRGPKGFVDVKPAAGWHKSAVFGASFKFVKSKDPLGNPRFRLEIKS